ncbi:hypothetical protein H1Q59_00375 [Holosporaceae bacterium 'Namur']|nr:hypothetical protein [Holosporaceae bacterium 'Namur']
MMKLKPLQTFYVLLTALLLVGCSSRQQANIKDFKALDNSKKGVVLFMITEDEKSLFHSPKRQIALRYTLYRLFGEDISKEGETYESLTTQTYLVNFKANYASTMLFLKPGLYVIYDISLIDYSNVKRWYKPRILDKGGAVIYGAFEVRPGEVTGLGRLDVTDEKFNFIKEDNKIIKDLESAGYKDLVAKIKPGVFYEPGSLVYTYNDVNKVKWKVIPQHEIAKEMQFLMSGDKGNNT